MKKVLAIILSLVMVLTCSGIAAFAEDTTVEENVPETEESINISDIAADLFATDLGLDNVIRPLSHIDISSTEAFAASMTKVLYGIVDLLIDAIVGAINFAAPSQNFIDCEDYATENFYEGHETFLDKPAEGAQWSLGYSSASIQTGDELDGNHYVGGSLDLDKYATAIMDDQRVRVISIDDGSGRGAVVFACIDAFGLALPDVREIRERLVYFAEANGIASINISVLHQHSCVDTYGMNAPLLKAIAVNPLANIYNSFAENDIKLITGKNDAFMENLFIVSARAIREAYENMEPGKLYFSETDVSEYIREKREPITCDWDLNRLRFVPDNDANRETWLFNGPIHCVGAGAGGTDITGDYPYYMEQYINKHADANFMLILGAELAISSDYTLIPDGLAPFEDIKVYGEALAKKVIETNAPETEVAPLLNIRFREYEVPVTNQILVFAAKMGIVTNLAVSHNANDTDLSVVTEMGYMELGNDLAIAIIPGELEPSIAYGGALDETNSYRNEPWEYPSMQEIIGDRELLIFGVTNDQIGYILTDNDYSSIISGVNEEIVATGDKAGSTTIVAFQELIDSIK
ncbi:MAG: hypothetical protein IJZ57_05270 [Clostridia bacterium]|nr:hypothetical protein [Clostridia bacterium]